MPERDIFDLAQDTCPEADCPLAAGDQHQGPIDADQSRDLATRLETLLLVAPINPTSQGGHPGPGFPLQRRPGSPFYRPDAQPGQAVWMISLEDCIALCGLTEKEVLAIAEHEHMPEAAAAVLGRYLLTQPQGLKQIQRMIVDDIRAALDHGNMKHAAELVSAMRHLMATHPEATGSIHQNSPQ